MSTDSYTKASYMCYVSMFLRYLAIIFIAKLGSGSIVEFDCVEHSASGVRRVDEKLVMGGWSFS